MNRGVQRMLAIWMAAAAVAGAEWQNLWPGEAPGAKRPPAGSEKIQDGWRFTDIEVPQIEVHLPPAGQRSGAAVVILPGGGYGILAMQHEGHDYAKWLNQRGIAGIVVKYRVSGNATFGYQFPVPLLDARRALRTVRARAAEWGLDPHKVGVMGSSAGGHLASMCATLFGEQLDGEGDDAIDRQDCRPDFAILVYPVIAMAEPYGHTGSRKNLLGNDPPRGLLERVSTERRVTAQTPPCFLVHAADDGGVPVRNSLEFAARCAEAKVPVVCHVFAKGGHGFGLGRDGDSKAWPPLLEAWLRDGGWGR
jgi:acetyl esterase/lipase